MNIGTALNKKYIPYTTVMIASLCINNKCHVDAYLFNSELEGSDLEKMGKALSSFDVTLHSIVVDKKNFNEKMPRSEQWSLEAYYRLFMFELLSDTVERMLYLDGDIVVNKDISMFYDSSFDGADMVVCDDKSGLNKPESYGNKHREMFADAYKKGFRYFNSGVLLINVKDMRKRYSFDTYLEAMKKWNYEMEAPDQDILNFLHWERVKYADCKVYDLFARVAHNQNKTYSDVKENVAIIHYTGYKPWESGNFHFDIEKIWWEYAKEMPFFKELLDSFVIDVVSDRKVADYIRSVEKERNEKKKLLSKVLGTLEKIMGGSSKEMDKEKEPIFVSEIDKSSWNGGYIYPSSGEYIKSIDKEKFLDDILSNDNAENYVLSLYDEIDEIDKALQKANGIIAFLQV